MGQRDNDTFSGYVAIVGRPNVGKSTLLNHILGQKIAITSRKPQTTRHNLLGIKTENNYQAIYVDTPGIHSRENKAINRFMNKSAVSSLKNVDVVLFVVDRSKWTEEDKLVLEKLKWINIPIVVAINKADRINEKNELLPVINFLSENIKTSYIVPVSALNGHNLDQLERIILNFLPKNNFYYPSDQITDRNSRFLASEIVREKIIRQLGAELPHQIAVEIEQFKENKNINYIDAIILIERIGQKKIIIGSKGDRIKKIGIDARISMELLFEKKVMLNLWVKVKKGWSDDERALQSLGYKDYS